jgi:uncharacterized membrane protein
MDRRVVSAVFDSQNEAERALTELRALGVPDRAVSVVAQHDGKTHTTHGTTDHHDHDGDKTRTGIGTGLGLGALLGFGSLLIPGVGPFIAGGALAETLGVAGAIGTGALAGGAIGGLAGALKEHGVSDDDSRYYEERIRGGGYFLSVDTRAAGVDDDRVSDVLHRFGGHSAGRARTTATTY